MKKSILLAFVLIIVVNLGMISSSSAEVMPRADSVFHSVTGALYSDKWADFSCCAYEIQGYIKVPFCFLQKEINGQWYTMQSIPHPSYVAYNRSTYGAEIDYSDYIGSGKFRFGFKVDADGHVIIRYSNARTF